MPGLSCVGIQRARQDRFALREEIRMRLAGGLRRREPLQRRGLRAGAVADDDLLVVWRDVNRQRTAEDLVRRAERELSAACRRPPVTLVMSRSLRVQHDLRRAGRDLQRQRRRAGTASSRRSRRAGRARRRHARLVRLRVGVDVLIIIGGRASGGGRGWGRKGGLGIHAGVRTVARATPPRPARRPKPEPMKQ